MNPVKQIGRYQLPILNVMGAQLRTGWRVRLVDWLIEKLELPYERDAYNVLLNNGQVIRFTETEKQQWEAALNEHGIICQVYGMAKGIGLRG